MFSQKCHPYMAPGDANISPRNASRIHTCHLSGGGPTGLRARGQIGSARKSESRHPENGVSRWLLPNSIFMFVLFCQQCHQSLSPGNVNIQPINASRIHTCHFLHHNFVYISTWKNKGTKSMRQNLFEILLWIVMPTFRKSCLSSCEIFDVESILIMFFYLKQICGINQA